MTHELNEPNKPRPGYGVSLPQECLAHLDPWLVAQSTPDAARHDPDVLRAVVAGCNWTALTEADRAMLKGGL